MAGVAIAAACGVDMTPQVFTHQPFLINRSSSTTDVSVTWVLRNVPCGTSPAALAATLDAGALDDPRTLMLARGQVAVLDGVPPPGASPIGACSTGGAGGECVAAILQAGQATPVLMVATRTWIEERDSSFSCTPQAPPESLCRAMRDPGIDAGPDAVSLMLVGGELRFSAANTDKIAISAIDVAAVAARGNPDGSCRATRDAYHQLLDARDCTIDADCQTVTGLLLPGEMTSCSLIANVGAAQMLHDIEVRWNNACISPGTCPLPAGGLQPRCLLGRCTDSCIGVEVPICPPSCHQSAGGDLTEGTPCTGAEDCMADDRRHCVCQAGVVTCASYPTLPDCPYDCLPPTH